MITGTKTWREMTDSELADALQECREVIAHSELYFDTTIKSFRDCVREIRSELKRRAA